MPDSTSTNSNTEAAPETLGDDSEPSSDDLLAVTIAYETIVSETSPAAQLPTEATTSVEVHAAVAPDLIEEPIEPVGDVLDETPAAFDSELELTPEAIEEADFGAELAEATEAVTASNDVETLSSPGGVETTAASIDPSEASHNAAPVAVARTDKPSGAPEVASSQAIAEAESPAADEGEAQPAATTDARPTAVAVASAAATSSADVDADSLETPSAPRVEPLGVTSERTAPQAERAETAPPTQREAPTAVDPARFVSRVTRAFDLASQRGGGPIEMRLSPPELGSMQLRLELKEGVLTASMETETQAARNALLDNLPALRDRLAEQQIRVEKFDVDVRDESQQPGDQRAGTESDRSTRDRDGEQPRRDASGQETTRSTEPATARPAPASILGAEAINVIA